MSQASGASHSGTIEYRSSPQVIERKKGEQISSFSEVSLPFSKHDKSERCSGEWCILSGTMFSLDLGDFSWQRNQAISTEMTHCVAQQTLYLTRAAPAPLGHVSGSTSPLRTRTVEAQLLSWLKTQVNDGLPDAIVGYGPLSQMCIQAFHEHNILYLNAPAECGALLAKKVIQSQQIANRTQPLYIFRKLIVQRFPAL
ncbi:MAG: hypothetical protein AAGJ35_06265, partial [Myxococcota bacterium]